MRGAYIFLAYTGLFLIGIIENARGPVYPDLLKIFEISSVKGSWIFSISSFTSFIMSINVGIWLTKFKDVGSTRLALFLGGAAAIGMGIAGMSSQGYLLFLAANFLLGVSIGIITITINLLIVRSCQVSRQRKVLSGLHSMYGLASLMAPAIIAFLYKRDISWYNYFIFFGILAWLLILLTLPTKSIKGIADPDQKKAPLSLSLLIGCALSCYVAAEVLISSRLVYYLAENLNYEKAAAGEQLSIFFFFLLVGRLASGHLPERLSASALLIFSLISSTIIVSLGLFYNPRFLIWSGLTMSYFFPMMLNFITTKFPNYSEQLLAKVMMYIGGMLTFLHLVFGQVAANMGLLWAMSLILVFLLISLALLLFINFSRSFAKLS